MSLIIADRLTKTYDDGESVVTAINNISFTIDKEEFVAVMGESGAGKSTLLDVIGSMNKPTSGNLWVDDIDVYKLTSEKRADFRREYLGFVFQSYYLVSYLTVLENVMLPLTTTRLSSKSKRDMARAALEWVGLERKESRMPEQISGGEKERVAIARAIVNNPPILLADEPTGNLDSKTSGEIIELLGRLNHEGMTIIMVTHSHECARSAQRRLTISDGVLSGDMATTLPFLSETEPVTLETKV